MYKTDSGGYAFKCNDIKISSNGSTWGTKLSQLAKMSGVCRIITYSLPDIEYVKTQLHRRPYDIYIIAHSKFISKAKQIKTIYPSIKIATNDEVHSKILLIEPHTVYISSANFGNSTWHETTIGLHSKDAHEICVKESYKILKTME